MVYFLIHKILIIYITWKKKKTCFTNKTKTNALLTKKKKKNFGKGKKWLMKYDYIFWYDIL